MEMQRENLTVRKFLFLGLEAGEEVEGVVFPSRITKLKEYHQSLGRVRVQLGPILCSAV